MDLDPPVPPYKTSDRQSFAYKSCKDRWPVILTGAIDDMHRTTTSLPDGVAKGEGRVIIEGLAQLKYELLHDRKLTPIPDDGQPDMEEYNRELEQLDFPSWFDAPWLFAECYLYRRISTFFSLSTRWKGYDVFSRQKLATFKSSRPAVVELAARYKDLIMQLESPETGEKPAEETDEAEEVLFTEICEICLWGNATDLSLLTNLSYDDVQKLQGSSARKAAEANILVNHLPSAFATLKNAQRQSLPERRVDIVLDNAGFELFVDLILAGYLLASGLATVVVLHPKSIPWFVSDVIPADFGVLLNALADPQRFYTTLSADQERSDDKPLHAAPLTEEEVGNLAYLFKDWSERHAEGQIILRPNTFWTRTGSYWRLQRTGKEILADLRNSQLVIFKGDLNYRKLTGDAMWPITTSFAESLGPLAHTDQGLTVLALRTCKADVVVGLDAGMEKIIKGTQPIVDGGAREWAWSGKWALVQFHNGRADYR